MSLAILTLPTNKSISTVSDHVRKIGQGEAGQKLEVIVTDADGSGYNLDGKTLEFSENKEGGKIVSDNDQGRFEIKDAKAGRFVYTLAPAVYAASGVAWFDITSADGSVIDTTKNFNIDVIEDESIHINNDNYVSSLASFETHYDGVIKKAKEDSEALLTKIDGQLSQALADNNKKAADSLTDQKAQLQKLIDSTNQLQTDWNAQFTKQKQSLSDVDASWQTQSKKIQDDANSKIAEIESNADTQKNAIQQAADDQLKANKNANDAEIAKIESETKTKLDEVEKAKNDAIADLTAQRDAAISQAKVDFQAKIDAFQKDYESWKTTTLANFNELVEPLKTEIATNQQDLKDISDQIAATKKETVNLSNQLDSIDLTNLVTGDQFKEAMAKKASGLKIRGLRGDYVMAVNANDSNIDATPSTQQAGLVDSGVLAAAVQALADAILDKNHYTKQEVDDIKKNILDTVTNKTKDMATTQDVAANAQRITALENAGFAKIKLDGFSTANDAQKWSADNNGISIFADESETV